MDKIKLWLVSFPLFQYLFGEGFLSLFQLKLRQL